MTRFQKGKNHQSNLASLKVHKKCGRDVFGPVKEAKRYILSNSSPLEQGN